MKKVTIMVAAVALLLVSLTTSAMAWNQSNTTNDFGKSFDQIQMIWVSGDKFAGTNGFWYADKYKDWTIYNSADLFVATRTAGAVASTDPINMNFVNTTLGSTSFIWQQFNGSTLNGTQLWTTPDDGKHWTITTPDVIPGRLANPPAAVPEPGTILAALSILGPAGLAFRRRRA